ncbi:MAG: M20/M25/M40 family metallo-hydrolase [candidate division Zixibacteria bacterium]|nr:M20/M25/M40 family metallo-hydrolase [candidate division Zixibacteria bacterium]
MKRLKLSLLICLALILAASNSLSGSYKITGQAVYEHISILADDSLEGRQVGEAGEWKAAQYISSVFDDIGLARAGDNGSNLQAFIFTKKIELGQNNRLSINGQELKLIEEFEPMRQSASLGFSFENVVFVNYGIIVDSSDGSYSDYDGLDVDGQAVIIKRYAPDSTDNPHVDFSRYSSLTNKISTAISQGAAGIFFITPSSFDDTLPKFGATRITPKDIPIVHLRRAALEKLKLDLDSPLIMAAVGETELVKTRDTGYNVLGLLDTGNDSTVIIGAHYDHLGWGAAGSRYLGKEKMIHNGADDNASGVAAILELARYFESQKDELNYSILFAAFSGEEAGLLGSNYFSKNMTVNSEAVRMMINFDMIGRLKDQESGLAIFGTGTTEQFKFYFDSLDSDELQVVNKEPGTGPSDHTSFYNQGIPVLHFFTGAHNDYHKPSDDIDSIDIEGTVKVIELAAKTIKHFDMLKEELLFQKTVDPNAGRRRASFSVTLGIMPDYIAEVKGLRVDGVTPERPGDRAGLLSGDIIIGLGGNPIGDIYDYMNCLGKFRKHDTTYVVVERANDTLKLEVIFE